jgi:anti-sigma factor ChrR (cupin superfamily)
VDDCWCLLLLEEQMVVMGMFAGLFDEQYMD